MEIGSRSTTLIFGIESCLFVRLLSPVVPSGRQNVAAQVATYKHGLCIGAPGTRQVDIGHALVGRQAAIVEDIALLLPLVGRGSRDVTFRLAMDVATVEHGRRPSEDEVYRPFDVAILVILAATLPISVERVLLTQEATVLEIGAVGTDEAGDGLPYRP